MNKPLSLTEYLDLDLKQANELYSQHMNPGLLKAYRALGLSGLDPVSAEGMELRLHDGRTVLDFSASIGVVSLGHNHPRVLAAEQLCRDRKLVDAIKVAPHRLQAGLAHLLAQTLPGDLDVAFLAVSGAEAVEAGMKICEKAQGPEKTKFLAMRNSFHGKTHGALSVTTSGRWSQGFLLGIPRENVALAKHGDLEDLKRVVREETHDGKNPFIAVMIEVIQGEGLEVVPDGYLKGLVEFCKENDILTLFDEVKMGMGRSGRFCAFEREEGVVPDVVTLSKALGGGRRAIAAMVSTRALFKKAYGGRGDASLHTSTFSGLGSSCAVAIEALNVYYDDDLIGRSRTMGLYLREKLEALKAKHSDIIELRGEGLVQGIRLGFKKPLIDKLVDTSKLGIFKTVDAVCMVSVVRELFHRHGILCHFAPSCPDVLHIMPPLIVEEKHLDVFAQAIDDVLQRGIVAVVGSFITGNVSDLIKRTP